MVMRFVVNIISGTERCDDRFGGPRTITHKEGQVKRDIALGEYSMFDFGLDYEGYDVKRDIYHTDSGGNQRTIKPLKVESLLVGVTSPLARLLGCSPIQYGGNFDQIQ